MQRLPVYILGGGRSRRFGSDKARAELGGVPLIVRILESVEPFATEIWAVADRPDKYQDLGLKTLEDRTKDCGPLGGIQAALEHLIATQEAPCCLVLCCDLVDIQQGWVEQLLTARTDESWVVAFREQRWQPFPGLYDPRLLPQVEERLARGQLSLQGLCDAVPSLGLKLPDSWPEVAQVNTQEELERVRAWPGFRSSGDR